MMTSILATVLFAQPATRPGFSDTPFLPGGKWRVHDSARPWPEVRQPKAGTDRPRQAPKGAILVTWQNAAWEQPGGILRAANGNNVSREALGNGHYHVEWRTPVDHNSDQGSGNSGVFLLGQYEIQVLNCYENRTYADGHAAALYGQMPPKFNVCRPQGQWQTYEIDFVGPVFRGNNLVQPGVVMVVHNGVKVQDRTKILGATVWRSLATYHAHAPELPLMLQDHGSPVEFRNIWFVPAQKESGAECASGL